MSISRKCHNYYKYGNFRLGFIFAKLRILFSLNYAVVKTFVQQAWSSVYHSRRTIVSKISENDQDLPHSQTSDQPMAP